MPICLICGKKMEWLFEDCNQVDDGGNVTIEFHFGSRHDQMLGYGDNKSATGYICDNCFDKIEDRLH